MTWPLPLSERPFPLYAVQVEGVPVPVWTGRVRETRFRPEGCGGSHMVSGPCEWCGFARFDFSGSVEVVVEVARDFQSATILPRRLQVQPTSVGRTIRFHLDAPAALTLILDGRDDQALHLFTHRPEPDRPDPDDPRVVYFGPGEHWVNSLSIQSGQTVYVDGGALVRAVLPAGATGQRSNVLNLLSYGSHVLNLQSVEDVTIRGRGVIDATLLPHLGGSMIVLQDCRRVRVEGVTLRNAAGWNLCIRDSTQVEVEQVACISGRYNSDGVNCVSSQQVRVRDCFVRNHDDSFAVKAMNPQQPARDIRYERCSAWNDWGYGLGITYETRADIHEVWFQDCDVIYACHWPLGIHVVDSGTVHDVHFENIDIEYPATEHAPRLKPPALVKLNLGKDNWAKDAGIGQLRDITFRNIRVQGHGIPPIRVTGHSTDHQIQGIMFDHLQVNGQAVDALNHPLVQANEFVRDVSFRTPPSTR